MRPDPPSAPILLHCCTMKPARSFASDNNAGIHPEVLKAISAANHGHAVGYGDDPYTNSAVQKFKRHFGDDAEVFIVFNGTAANCLSLKALTDSFHAVICTAVAHIYTDECAAPEKFTGCKLIPIAAADGKLTVESVSHAYRGIGDQHHVQPRVISITQATETGTVYKPDEIKALARFTRDLGLDVLSFGGTKNGLMGAEAVVFFDRKLARNFQYLRKQGMQLASKMRFISAQFEALLTNDLWLQNAQHANRMARLLQREVSKFPQVKIVYKVEANGVFAKIPRHAIAKLQKRYFFYVWNEEESVVRWMCSFDTTAEDVQQFAKFVAEALRR